MPGQNPNVNRTPRGSSPQAGQPKPSRAEAKRTQVFEDLELDPQNLGDRGSAVADEILARFQKKNKINRADLARATDELRDAHQKDLAEAYQPSEAPAADQVKSWASTSSLKQTADGNTKLTGAASNPSHPLAQLLSDLQINPKALGPKTSGIIQEAIDRKADLSAVWDTLARSLLLAHMQDTKSIVATAATVEPTPANPIAPQTTASDLSRSPELAATAPNTTGVGNANGALAARIQNMMGSKAAHTGRKQALRALSKSLVSDLGLPSKKSSSVSSLIGRIVKNSVGSDGSVRSSRLAEQAFFALANEEPNTNQVGPYAMAHQLLQLIDAQSRTSGKAPSAAIDNLTANLAAFGLRSYVAESLGKEVAPPSDEILAQMQTALAELTGKQLDSENLGVEESSKGFDRNAAEAEIANLRASREPQNSAATKEAPSSENPTATEAQAKASASQAASSQAAPVSDEARAAAQQVMAALNINPADPNSDTIRQAYEQILESSKGDPAQMYMAATQWLDENMGSNRAEHDGKLLEQGIAPAMLQTMLNDRFATIAAFITNPKEIKEKFLMHERMSGPGANAGLEGNGLGGTGGFKFGTPNSYGTSGLLGPGSPMDADGSKNQIYAQRSLQINSILNDPALSIEDKIFYFMMWFAAYADKEREQKMREIADLDTQNQENTLKRKELERNRQALYQSRKVMQQGVQAAEGKLRSLSPKHEEIKDVKQQIAKLESGENPDQTKIQDLQKKLGGLERLNRGNAADIEKASKVLQEAKSKRMQVEVKIEDHSKQIDGLAANADSGTKSRELLFMELERIQRFRGMLIDMANSFMRDMARRVKEIMQ